MPDIQYVYPLIHNKVTSPHYVTPTLRRARLIGWLNDAADCRAVVIAAEAGYGKTTLLWQWEREVEFPCYWYKLDRNDRDWSLHISYLIEAIGQRHERFGRRAHAMLEQLGGPGSSRPGVAAYLLAEMHERLTEPCTFIIDDWQFVASVTEVRGLWNQILRDAPPTCRFVFLSRAKPQLQFARFKTHGGYAELRTDALRFTDREIDELFRDIYNDPLDPTELVELERRTEGWAASLQLVEVSLRERHTPEARRAFIESITATRDSDLVEFLAEEVLDQQPPHVRNFLLATSVLQRITPELAGRLAGEHDGERLLRELEGRGLFTYRLGSEGGAYRYHGLFREFLERRLAAERSPGEVDALHIHAASYFETSQSWPEAIHHYLRAKLQPQAARLIAKYGEDLAAAGRLPLLDEWLQQLPTKVVVDNARLSLLAGEIRGVRGDWEASLRALERARAYFRKKGDRRMEAVACSKLSTVYNNLGDAERSGLLAREGLELVSDDDLRTRLRLRGNLAITAVWLESLERAEQECMRVAAESEAAGLEQFAAIAYHNLGVMLRYAGRLDESLRLLERAARYWDASPSNPFADNSELVQALLLMHEDERAHAVAESAIARTRPWPRPNAEAWYGLASVLAYRGQHREAAEVLRRSLLEHGEQLGAVREKITALLITCLYLDGSASDELRELLSSVESLDGDPRLAPTSAVAAALAAHRLDVCSGQCRRATDCLNTWEKNGSRLVAALGRIPLALLAMEHRPRVARKLALDAIRSLHDVAALPYARSWLGRLVPQATVIAQADNGRLLSQLIAADPSHWIPAAAAVVPNLRGATRATALDAIEMHADEETQRMLRGVNGADVQDLRRRLVSRFADRIHVRAFGPMTIHRGSWDTAGILVPKRRMRLVLGLALASGRSGLTRDEVLDTLWSESEPGAAINSLNQTVFQLRRLIDQNYREGEAPQYLHSSAELLQLNPELVVSDLDEVRRYAAVLRERRPDREKVEVAQLLVSLIKGEFLSDLRYEDWVASAQIGIHAEVRAALLPIAEGVFPDLTDDLVLRAGRILTTFDPYDEHAHLAIAKHFASSGRRKQARDLLGRFVHKLRTELDEDPSRELQLGAALVGVDLGSVVVD